MLVVEGAQISDTFAESTVQVEATQQLEVIQQRLMTRANLVDISNKFRVFRGEGSMSPDDIVDRMRDQTEISISAGRDRATFMTISFTSNRAKISADVVNEFVTLILAEDAEIRGVGSRQTLEFFVQQVEQLDQQLARQSAEIVAYKEANKDALPESPR